MDDTLLLVCLCGVGLLQVVGVLAVYFLLKKDRWTSFSRSGIEARDEIESERMLMLAEIKAKWENKTEGTGLNQFIQKDLLDIAFKYPRASTSFMRDAKAFIRDINKLGLSLDGLLD